MFSFQNSRRITLLALAITLLLISTTAHAKNVGVISIDESSNCVVLTREDHSPKVYTGGLSQGHFNRTFSKSPDLIAYVIYPKGPSCLIYDTPTDQDIIKDIVEAGNLYSYSESIKDYWYAVGCDYVDVECISVLQGDGIVMYFTAGRRAWKSISFFYSKDDEKRSITICFDDYEDIPVWNAYIGKFVGKLSSMLRFR